MQKARQRKRLRAVDKVVDTVSAALQRNGGLTTKAVARWYNEMPREEEMLPKDKYTIFDRKEKKYRKGIHTSISIDYGHPHTARRQSNFTLNETNGIIHPSEGSIINIRMSKIVITIPEVSGPALPNAYFWKKDTNYRAVS
ncbi:hypothetical protein PRK78_002564 [Emydomyces testavorans]|uniref:Uncharacterized protein n=1 Tax=Emydomyces testavorans TaxID=2070801 RepID=A0AAF0IJS4_9EURO|nr:hypothetical protein PRK78_002564 [Emydomyces testavorans]